MYESMILKVLTPDGVFAEIPGVVRLVVDTPQGAFGLMPNRLDCVGALAPGILTYETKEEGTVHLAVDRGIMVKAGPEVLASVRRAIGGLPLGRLHEAVKREFAALSEREEDVGAVLAKLESGFLRQLQKLQRAQGADRRLA